MSHFSQAIDELISQVATTKEQDIRIAQPLTSGPNVACIDWLEAQPHFPKFYWQSRDLREEVVALGKVHTFSEPAPAYTILGENQRIWGGKSFASSLQSAANPTESLPRPTEKNSKGLSAYFFLPQIELVRFDNQWSLCVNLADSKAAIINALQRLSVHASPLPVIECQVESVDHCPNEHKWYSQIDDVLMKIRQNQFKKVVLARKTTVELDSAVSAAQLLKSSWIENKHSFHFLFALDESQAFIGSTPERLYSRNGQELETEALAGTIGRGNNQQKDSELANWLTNDRKNLTENQYVVDDIIDRLSPYSHSIDVQTDARLVQLRKVQHLKRNIQAHLKQGINGVQLLSALQPTAAVAGLPREAAIRYIHDHEPFSRGWYSGSMGYISHQKAEFCVAIRSAFVAENELHLYAGAGIVEGSQADVEWNELDKKMATLLSLLEENSVLGVIS
ncbi:isochorismate synthase [Vibrio sp. TH_r3]|uniref:isochorismate synthase n=1 Tax=Vibrio sp. TH_r3 TaxID=3082084 RepID=UPI0029533ABC|nr:isochorismate synthase [Vibrio sp. TH_r3]MDV7104000.1 isochorismate synthase [Vibrio sp. TH_r3]